MSFEYDPSRTPTPSAMVEAARSLGVTLTEERSSYLAVTGLGCVIDTEYASSRLASHERIEETVARSGGFHEATIFRSGGFIARLILTQSPHDEDVGIYFDPRPKLTNIPQLSQHRHHTKSLLSGIRGLQNYLILLEAGCMRSPRLLYGHADTSMALLAGRVGFRRTTVEFGDEKTEILGATPEAVKSKVFGEEMRYCEYLLERRLTRAGIDHENWYF